MGEDSAHSPGHVLYDRLQNLLGEAGFDAFVEETCEPIYAPRMSAPSLLGRRRSRLVEREVSRFPHKERPHMSRSPTTPGQMRRSRWRAPPVSPSAVSTAFGARNRHPFAAVGERR